MALDSVVITRGWSYYRSGGTIVDDLYTALLAGESGVIYDEALTRIGGLRSQLVSKVSGIDAKLIPRKNPPFHVEYVHFLLIWPANRPWLWRPIRMPNSAPAGPV